VRSKSGALIVAICVAVVVVGSVLLWLGHRPRAAMVGDSLLFDARSQVHDDLRTWRVTISAFPGTTIGQQLPQAERLAATHPKALVLVLGANNTIDGVKGDDEHEVDLMVDAVRSVGCVRWVNVADATPRPTFNVAAEEFNRMLVAKTSGHSNVAVVDWAASARQHPDWFKPGDVHLTSAGSSALAKAISASLDGC
jgi:hypothetical protein